ncbi:uncharacterized protein LOC114526261 isoform X2 [Dendronephthya gigantea]|uniref:uncharacterized protein LOC114526261 isoform X2 n=1 Tax=Dendronephthya gigantea TaxID=151771 RepID=UPI0010692698|nr:uncharacterized protein LOC114526261 isoform X2 [Dendronephthya gigantea]
MYKNTVCNEKLVVGNKPISNDQLSASSSKATVRYAAKQGKLDHGSNGWCADDIEDDKIPWFQVDFNDTKTITAVELAGPRGQRQHVNEFTLKYSYDGQQWYNYVEWYKNRKDEVELKWGAESVERSKKIKLPSPITTRLIRIYPNPNGARCLRVELYGCNPYTDCTTPVGMEDGRILDEQINASSHRYNFFPAFARLNNKRNKKAQNWGAWCAEEDDRNIYLEVDLRRKRNISQVATQGYAHKLFTRSYRLNYSTDGNTWEPCRNKQKLEFAGNTDNDTVKIKALEPMVIARYIRFIPTDWNFKKTSPSSYPCMRAEIYECLPVKGSVPEVADKSLQKKNHDADIGGNSDLKCTMTGQSGIILSWYKEGELVKESKNIKIEKPDVGSNRKRSILKLYNVSIDDNGVRYECRGMYPGVASLYASDTFILSVGVRVPLLVYPKTEKSVVAEVPYRLANITEKYVFEYRAVTVSEWTRLELKTKVKGIEYSITGLKPWTKYEVKVTPVHRNGDKDPDKTSDIKSVTTLQGTPDALLNVHVYEVKSLNATLKWDKPSRDRVRGVIKKYVIGVFDKSGNQIDDGEVSVPDGTSFVIHNLLPDTNYTAKVAVENGRRQSPSISVSFTTRAEIPEPTTAVPKPPVGTNLETLNKMKIDDDNAESVAIDVKNLTSKPDELNPRNVSITAEILKKIVDTNTNNVKVGDSILKTLSNILDVDVEVLDKSNSSTRFIRILENFVEKGGEFSKNTSNIKIRILTDLDVRSGIVQQKNNGTKIIIPKEVLNLAKNKTMYFIYYKNGNLFKRRRFLKETCVDGFTENIYEESTPVISSGIPGTSVKNLTEKVIIKFHVADPKAVTESSSCVFWDFDAAGGTGNWSRKGCTRQKTYNNTIECACDHMTNFAALMDVHAATSKVCGPHADVFQIVSYVGCSLSILGLLLTIFTYMFFRRLRKELAAKILIQLCIALLCVLVVFVVGFERSLVDPLGCYIVAVLLHYFILAAFMWMLIEAHFMYLAFVKVWSQHGDHELLKCSFIAWGLPAIIVGITMAVDLDNYGGGHYCRINRMAFFVAFLAPVMCVVFVNLVVFGIIMYKLNSRPDSSLGRDRSAMIQRLKQAVGIMILVGVTWIFGALAIRSVRLTFQYIFIFFNSIQGLCIFMFYCLSQKNVRDSWKALLTCQLSNLHKDKSFHTNTYDRRRCSTASTTHNNTLSLARKKTSTSSGNMAYPTHSMDTLTREFASYNCSSGTLPGSKETNKPIHLNNFKPKDCNLQNGSNSNNDIWKRFSSNGITNDEQTPNSVLTDTSLTRSHSCETLCSNDSDENYHSYDLVASSEGSFVSLDSLAESQASDNRGFYSFVNSKDSCDNSMKGDSAPNTPREMKRPIPTPLTKKNRLTVPIPTKRMNQLQPPTVNDPLSIPDDFGKLIVNPSRGSVRGVRGVVETSVDTYDEDSNAATTPQGVRLTEVLNNDQQDKFGSNDCIASPMYFAQNNRKSKERNSSTNENSIGDICL